MSANPPEVVDHLRAEYRGVFGERQLARHVRDHLGLEEAGANVALVTDRAGLPARLLDVGCGYGSFVVAARAAGIDAVGIDLATHELHYARTRRDSDAPAPVARADATRLPFADRTFDAVTLWNVLEHLPDGPATLAEVRRVLRPGGHAFVLAPNYAAFRMEAHYHVPWAPLLRGRAASGWLRLWRRDPTFWEQQVHPCTALATTRRLGALGFDVQDFLAAKLDDDATVHIHSPWKRAVVTVGRRTQLLPVVRLGLRLRSRNPLRGSITVHATLRER